MTSIRKIGLPAALCAIAVVALAAAPPAMAGTKWRIDSLANSTAQPGGTDEFIVEARDVGDEDTSEPIEVTGTLPEGMAALEGTLFTQPWDSSNLFPPSLPCTAADGVSPIAGEREFKCVKPDGMEASAINERTVRFVRVVLKVEVAPDAAGTLLSEFEVSGGGASASTVDPTEITSEPPHFGVDAFDTSLTDSNGSPFTQAGGHPDSLDISFDLNTAYAEEPVHASGFSVEPARDVVTDLPQGFVGNPSVLDQCSIGDLNEGSLFEAETFCSPASQVGTVLLRFDGVPNFTSFFGPMPLFNMVPPPGAAARFGFVVIGTTVVIDARLRQDGSYALQATSANIPNALGVAGSTVTLWGDPGAAEHDSERACPGNKLKDGPWNGDPTCKSQSEGPFLRMPTSCPGGGLPWAIHADSWVHPGPFDSTSAPILTDPAWKSASALTHQAPGYPFPPSQWGEETPTQGCAEVPVKGRLSAKPTALEAETSSGLDVHVEVPNPGLENDEGISASDIEGVEVALPQGMTINPSQASGLGVCSPAQYESSRLEFDPDGAHGCPSDSKIGTVSVKTQLLQDPIPGNVYVAEPYENPFNSLLAIYIVLEEPQRGILVKLPGEIRTNEETGRIEAEFKDLPQVPFETFDFHFREGARAPLVTPPTCGAYTTETTFTPWSDQGRRLVSDSSFEITKGIGGGPCPPGGVPPFKPSFSAGSINANAGSFTPFDMRITRNDGEQDMTRFSAILPPGVLGRLAGVAKCPPAAIAAARAHTGPHGGEEEIEHPSCPANSQIGRSIVGAGVGSVLTYVPGRVYLGGPFHGDPLSVIAITPVVAGPFDVGTVVVQVALTLNPVTAEVEVDGSASEPIPHILKGIPAKLRDLRVYVDRPEFILNPTSCDPSSARATLFGGGGDAFTSADDVAISLSDRFQAASCASLGFKPRLGLKLRGGTRRGAHPALTATYAPRRGDANIRGLTVTLPRSAFLEQAHIRTICTRVQFAAKSCPKGAQYGFIRAWTPLLEEPLEGPVYLRSSNHKLPDLLFDLHGLVDIEVAVRIDSFHGGIRASLESAPDAPLSKVLLRMQGAKKGLIVNSRNLCGSTNRASVDFVGHNGRESSARPVMRAQCGKSRRQKHKRQSR